MSKKDEFIKLRVTSQQKRRWFHQAKAGGYESLSEMITDYVEESPLRTKESRSSRVTVGKKKGPTGKD